MSAMDGSTPVVTLRDRAGRLRRVAARQAGFTLVEMLVVLAIIGLLVGLVAPRVFGQLAEAKVRTAHIQIESFKNALDLFYLDAGRYPTTQEGLQALNTRPANVAGWGGPYVKGAALEPPLRLQGARRQRPPLRHHLRRSRRQGGRTRWREPDRELLTATPAAAGATC